ncbi:Nucleic acid-binding proteins superfamily [Rhynchospora pubera]|uniref:Nucleic acid-binding proteins superfamily n=1 Tax=Rhynchospora pubera TaxID=906938 RepID=A0AAV8FYM4_9POAL|nr:Nucleic acid-binding proteins superfamily [Rhynchospora pubera]
MATSPISGILSLPPSSEHEDPFLGFVEYARSTLASTSGDGGGESMETSHGGDQPPWSWAVSRILKTCVAYPSGITAAILLSDLFQAWNEQHKYLTSKRKPEVLDLLKKRPRRARLPNTITIDSIHEKNFISPSSVIEAIILNEFLLPGTNIYMLSLGDLWSSCTIDLYLHRRYYDYVGPNGILKKGREIFLTGCSLRTATEGSGKARLLPTEYVVILLDEDEDEDAMLLGAQFCTYSFSSISPIDLKNCTFYSFYARIESINSLENLGNIQRKLITLIDNEGSKMKFLLWGEQVLLANFFSVGSMLALDTPFISNFVTNEREESEELCLEYGSATQIYLVPVIQQEEQVVLSSTQMRSQEIKSSQISLPRDSHGAIDFSKYPFRMYVIDLGDKMSGVSLYGMVTSLSMQRTKASETIYHLDVEDESGCIAIKLHFVGSWSLTRAGIGHRVYISGLTCSMNSQKILEVSWFEKEPGSSFVNLSCLPAFLNSSCLHRLSCLSDISDQTDRTHICQVHLDQVEHFNIQVLLCHSVCSEPVNQRSDGLYYCKFCECDCDYDKCTYIFQLQISVTDESGKVYAWCVGLTASELLQISPEEFLELPEDERAMYLYTLQEESFMVAMVYCKITGDKHNNTSDGSFPDWEITRAQKVD